MSRGFTITAAATNQTTVKSNVNYIVKLLLRKELVKIGYINMGDKINKTTKKHTPS